MAQRFVVEEIEGTSPIRIELSGGLIPILGAEMPSELRGSSYTPLGAREGYSTVTGLTWDKSEMTCAWDAAFMRRDEMALQNIDIVFGPEGLLEAFVTLQKRGRECLVQLGPFTRRGVLRKTGPKPGRGYSVDPATGALAGPGVNIEVSLSWEWTGDGLPSAAGDAPTNGTGLAGQLGGASTKLGAGLADIGAFDPDLATSIGSAIGKLRKGIGDLRKTLKGLGDLARLPAKTASQLLGAARSVGNLVNDARNLLSDTTDDFKALGEAAKGAAAAVGLGGVVGPTAAKKAAAKRAAKGIAEGVDATVDAVVAIFDAIARRKPRTVGVRPGQSLAEVARAQLGTADRWPEIAEANGIDGQAVPAGTFQIEIPPKGT